jgi:hypothetical protein
MSHSMVAVAQSRPTASDPRGDLLWAVLAACDGRLKQITCRETALDEAPGVCATATMKWNTVYFDAALTQLRAEGHPASEEDIARLSVYVRRHLNVQGRHSFQLPELAGARRALRDPDAVEDQA